MRSEPERRGIGSCAACAVRQQQEERQERDGTCIGLPFATLTLDGCRPSHATECTAQPAAWRTDACACLNATPTPSAKHAPLPNRPNPPRPTPPPMDRLDPRPLSPYTPLRQSAQRAPPPLPPFLKASRRTITSGPLQAPTRVGVGPVLVAKWACVPP